MELNHWLELMGLMAIIVYLVFSVYMIIFFSSVKETAAKLKSLLDDFFKISLSQITKAKDDTAELAKNAGKSLSSADKLLMKIADASENISPVAAKAIDSLANFDGLCSALNKNSDEIKETSTRVYASLNTVDEASMQLESSIRNIDVKICEQLSPITKFAELNTKIHANKSSYNQLMKYYRGLQNIFNIYNLLFKK